MPGGLAVLGAIAASYGLAKDIFLFCKRLHDAKSEIPAILLRFENDANLLGHLEGFFTEAVLESLDDESLDHLQRVFSYLLPILQSVRTRLSKYEHNTFWDRTRWAIVGNDLKLPEENIYGWIDRLQKCLVLFPNPVKSQLLLSVGGSSALLGTAMAHQRMEQTITRFREIGRQQTSDLGADLRLSDTAFESLQPSSSGQVVMIRQRHYLVEWKRIPASDANDERIQGEAIEDIIKLVSVLSAVEPSKMFSMRAIKYFEYPAEPTVPFGIVYELPAQFDIPVRLGEILERTDDRGGRVLKHSLDQRFELVRQIASAILFIHSIGWVHKGVQTSNIWLANRQNLASTSHTYPENLGTAFLAGFDYTRREISRSTGDEASGGGWRKALYQHPERFQQQGSSRQQQALRPPFIPEHDIYGLGVVLIEIGRWKPLDTYKHLFENATPLERKANLETMAEGLKVSMGRRYSEVCKRCLCILDGENRSIRDTPDIRHVLFDLEDLAAATS
jgi:hypothetical protein